MAADREAEIERICLGALERDTSARRVFLADVCAGDASLRKEVESLLAHEVPAGRFLETPAAIPFASGDGAGPTLAPGRRVGSYTILASLGAGGMGEVYRARDTKLGREVAIKVLRGPYRSDPDRQARFEREARVLATLNHPHIAAIYGLEEGDGVRALVLELVEGQTLAERLAAGPLPVSETLAIAQQVAEGLEVAHEKGIAHRDLKPANIKVTPAGVVKLLDFGIAKVVGSGSRTSDEFSPTSQGHTGEGVTLGTAAYMSPEQVRGLPIDRRTDIWAFGCVLFEMFTGRPAFSGPTPSDIASAVLQTDPDWSLLPAETSVAVRVTLKWCLKKDARQRLRDIGDVQLALTGAFTEVERTSTTETGSHATTSESAPASTLWFLVSVVLLVASITLAGAWFYQRPSRAEGTVVRFSLLAPEKTAFVSGGPGNSGYTGGSISPNGRKLAFAARNESGRVMLWVRVLDTLAAQSLAGTDGAAMPFWSPDSQSIAFFAQGKLKKIDLEGGPARILCDAPSARGGTWGRQDVIVFAGVAQGPLSRVSAAGGETTAATKQITGQQSHRFPFFLPDGKHFLYFVFAPESGVYVASLDSLDSHRLLAADAPAAYAGGYVLFLRDRTLLAQRFDPVKLQLSGDVIPAAEQVASGGPGPGFSVSDNGVLEYRTGLDNSTPTLSLDWVDRAGTLSQTVGPPGRYQSPDLSPDGKQIAMHRHDGAGGDVWTVELPSGKTSRLTFGGAQENISPLWSPDGSRIVFASVRNGKWGIYEKSSNGTGAEELLMQSEFVTTPTSWSADGNIVLYNVVDPKTGPDIWALPLTGDRQPFPVLQTSFSEVHPQISPNGKLLAYASNETGRSEIYLQTFPPGRGKWQISSGGGQFARWRRDGKELFFLDSLYFGNIVSASINATADKVEFSPPRVLFASRYIYASFNHTGAWNAFAVSPDGQRFLIPRSDPGLVGALTNTPINIVLNWTAALKH